MKFARSVANTAVDVRSDSPEGFFTPEVVAEFIQVPDEVQSGWICVDGVWSAPPSPPEPEPTPEPTPSLPVLGPNEFKMLFTIDELAAIDAAIATDTKVKIFMKMVDDPRTTVIDRNASFVQNGIRYMESAEFIGEGRADEVIYGMPS